jgi:S1-C subfamily serine protease
MDGKLIGADPDSDLAVIEVDYPEGLFSPVQLADSTQVEVGQLAAAIGNPFGLDGTMTIGIVSALGRSLPVGQRINIGSTYSIPDVIQTDAPINPGNSGGVLVDMEGQLIGVPTAIESVTGVNSGIGFVIPSVIVQKVIPVLIEQGYYEHPWIGISGTTLNSDIAEEMDLKRDQRGVLVIDVVPDSPAESAGLIGSDRVVSIDEQEFRLGGDLIIKIDSQDVRDFEDLTAYLARYTESGQTVKLTLLRDGRQEELDLTLSVRPSEELSTAQKETDRDGDAWLGILGVTVSPEIAEAMDLSPDQTGILIQQVIEDSPADRAGLRGSYKSITVNREGILVGGDIITGLDSQEIDSMEDFTSAARKYQPGDEAKLKVLRDGETLVLDITFGAQP